MQYSGALPRAVLGGLIAGFLASFSPAIAAVYPPERALSAQTIQQFVADPAALLAQYPNGGPQLIAEVRDLAASDPATLKLLLGLLKSANADQASAIGTGLGQVAVMAVKTDEAYATEIQEDVVAAQNISTLVAFSAAVGGNIQLAAATGGGGGGGGGGGEEGTNPTGTTGGFYAGNPENFPTFVDDTPDNFPLAFSPGTVVSLGSTTIIRNVSPTTP
jgi:hypothetical protein